MDHVPGKYGNDDDEDGDGDGNDDDDDDDYDDDCLGGGPVQWIMLQVIMILIIF